MRQVFIKYPPGSRRCVLLNSLLIRQTVRSAEYDTVKVKRTSYTLIRAGDAVAGSIICFLGVTWLLLKLITSSDKQKWEKEQANRLAKNTM